MRSGIQPGSTEDDVWSLFQEMNGQKLDYHDAYILPQGLWSPSLNTLNVQYSSFLQ